MKRISSVLISLLLMAALVLTGCGKEEAPAPTTDPNLEVVEYALVANDAAALKELDVYVNLQKLDLRGSLCYEAIESYIAAHPQVQVTYDVEVAGTRYAPDVEQLKLEDGTYDAEQLVAVLKHLPKLTTLELPKTTLTAAQMNSIYETCPNLTVAYTVELFGQEMGFEMTEIDLSGMKPAELDESTKAKLQLLPGLTRVKLMTAGGSTNYAVADVKMLMDLLPDVAMDYSFDLFGQTVTTADERVEFVKVEIGNEGIPEIRAALDILPNCTYFLMDRCGVDNEVMAQLRDDYPNTKVVWRVYWSSKYNALTDTELISSNKVKTEQVQVLKYCTEVKYMDLGHSRNLGNIDFVQYMPSLKVLIIVDSGVVDLTPLENCKELEWIELVYCRNIQDISPLAKCTKLKGINMSEAYGVKDISCLYDLENLERLFLGKSSITKEMYEEACEELPNCWVTQNWYDRSGIYRNYAVGWRLNKNGTLSDFYKEFKEIFRYKENYYSGKGVK